MSLLDELASVGQGPACTFGSWVSTLPADERAAVLAAIADDNKPIRQLLDLFRKYGMRTGRDTLAKHRTDGCGPCRSQTT